MTGTRGRTSAIAPDVVILVVIGSIAPGHAVVVDSRTAGVVDAAVGVREDTDGLATRRAPERRDVTVGARRRHRRGSRWTVPSTHQV